MTNKIYKTAQGKVVDLGALILQNEKTRAVGNMNVNARGDILDSGNQVIETKNKQVQRQYRNTTNVTADRTVHTSTAAARNAARDVAQQESDNLKISTESTDEFLELSDEEVLEQPPVQDLNQPVASQMIPQGGLAAAIARSKLVKQEKEKTLREKQQALGLRKI